MLALSLATVIGLTSLTGCQSTTKAGATGVDRQQLLLVNSAQLNAEVAELYKKELAKARQANALDTPAVYANRVNAIFKRLLPHTNVFRPDGTQFNWEIHTINSDEVNAFCMPGGKMIVYTGIIKQLNLTDDELAAIIGHEMAHALREHTREKLSQDSVKSTGLSLVKTFTKINSTQMDLADMASQVGLSLPFSRVMETESDVIGLELMARAGYNPEAASQVWAKSAKLSAGKGSAFDALLSTHPTDENRLKKLDSLVPKVLPLYEEAKTKKAPTSTKGTAKRKKR